MIKTPARRLAPPIFVCRKRTRVPETERGDTPNEIECCQETCAPSHGRESETARLRAYGSSRPERTRPILRESSTLVTQTLSTKSPIASGLSVSARMRAKRAVRTTHSLPRRGAFVPHAPLALSPPRQPPCSPHLTNRMSIRRSGWSEDRT